MRLVFPSVKKKFVCIFPLSHRIRLEDLRPIPPQSLSVFLNIYLYMLGFFAKVPNFMFFSAVRNQFPNRKHVRLGKRSSAASQRSPQSQEGNSQWTGSALLWT